MRLKKIAIIGFKSFADKTVLEFSPGITGIVGPNGCGKSNIADAFRWVLGEQSAKSMRGSKMPDVIFAGTTLRKPLNFAEVTITLSEVAGKLPVAYDEIAITRRLHRSGESNYFINGQLVRLRDLQDLFLDSGMGKDAFSIFEQGKIDQVINYSPTERRHIFEEAAGILRFLQRKREALRKLEQVDSNTLRLKDIHKEVEKQIQVLEQQAEKARLFKEHKGILEGLEKTLLIMKWDQLQKRYLEAKKKQDESKLHIEEMSQQTAQLHARLHQAKEKLTQSEHALRLRSEDLFRARNEKELKVREQRSTQERFKEASHKEKQWEQELEGLLEKRQLRYEESQALQKKQKENQKLLEEAKARVTDQRERVETLQEAVAELREAQQKGQQELLQAMQLETQLESQLKQNAVRQENNKERQEQLQERKEKLVVLIQDLTQQVIEKKEQFDALSQAIDLQKKSLSALEQRLEEMIEEIQEAKSTLDTLQQEWTDLTARQKVLLRLKEEMEGFSSGSKRLLQESTNPKSPLYNLLNGLYEYITPKSGAENALAMVLRPYAQTLVVKSKADFATVLQFAKKQQLKEFSLLCIESLPANTQNRVAKQGLEPLLAQISESELASHFLKHVYIAENIEFALEKRDAQSSSIWTKEGYFLDSHGVVFHTAQGENNVFLREAELKVLEKRHVEIEEKRHELEEKFQELEIQRTEILAERNALDKTNRREEMKLVEVNFSLQRLNGDLEKAATEEKQLSGELTLLKRTFEEFTLLIAQHDQQHTSAKAKSSQIKQAGTTIHVQLEEQLVILKGQTQQLQEKELLLQQRVDEERKSTHALQLIEVKETESREQEKRLSEEIQLSKGICTQMESKGSHFEKALMESDQQLNEATSIYSALEGEVTLQKKAIAEEEKQAGGASAKQKKIEEELYRMGIQMAQLETLSQALSDELLNRYQLTMEMEQTRALVASITQSVEQIEKRIKSLKQEMEEAGDINMTSIDEFEKHKVRYDFLNQQVDDLNVSKQELIDIIAQLDTESRKAFKETFAIISENFKKNFKILFNGGEADLLFTETEDVLEAGIEIIAKPPGKQTRSIQLLSGGEKCLTAMALLFAIFEVKPAPFCILDEIDAPLDDTNVGRFANVVKQFIDCCQFIIITHNKQTMSIADILFGVSMEERGVSKLLSMQFSPNETAEDPLLALNA